MSLTLTLQIAIAAMGALSATLLGMGERQPLLPVLAVIVGACAVYFNDLKGWVRLSNNAANWTCLVAAGVALWDLARLGRDGQLLAAANLLVYLQCILLFQHKSIRRYWMLALLSLMQVSVAAALGLDLSFGMLMLAYLVVALTTLTLFCAHREIERYSESHAGFEELHSTDRAVQAGAIRSAAVGGQEAVSWRLLRYVTGMTTATFAIALALFFLVPRFEQDSWARRGGRGAAVTGIPDTVSLSEVGTIYESAQTVMQVNFVGPDGKFYELREPPLFRGFHVMEYRDNRWRHNADREVEPLGGDEQLYSRRVVQTIDAEPSETDVLFHVEGPETRFQSGELLWDRTRERILRTTGFRNNANKYQLANYAFEGGRQTRYTEAKWYDEGRHFSYVRKPASLARLAEHSKQLVTGVNPNDKMALIRKINEYLTDPRRFAYTLRPRRSDLNIDAVEDFVFNTRQGHCEYFASAMTLMLRSINIPARLVIGYKGGEFNKLGNFYQVRQLHAHAWVEAYFSPAELPADLDTRHGDWKHGAWYTIDPTPGSSVEGVEVATKVRFLGMRQVADYARFLWSSYVMGMDAKRQQQSVYSLPIAAAKNLADADNWKTAAEWLKLFFVPGHDPSGGAGWAALRLAVLGGIVAGSIYVVGRWLRQRWPALKKRFARRPRRKEFPLRAETLLFRRLETVLARHDFHRPEGQTPREFALAAGGLLAGSRTMQHVAQLPLGVVESFYRLRFAGRGLDKLELETLEQSLAQLESALAPSDSSSGPASK